MARGWEDLGFDDHVRVGAADDEDGWGHRWNIRAKWQYVPFSSQTVHPTARALMKGDLFWSAIDKMKRLLLVVDQMKWFFVGRVGFGRGLVQLV